MKKIFLLLTSFFCLYTVAQRSAIAIADKKYEKYAYIDAIKIYEKVVEKGYKSPDLIKKIANAYYFNGDLQKAALWYKSLFDEPENKIEPEYYYRYAQTLKRVENYKEASYYLKVYYEKIGLNVTDSIFNFNTIATHKNSFIVESTNLNTPYYDFGPTYYKEDIVFASSRTDLALVKKTHQWTKQNFTDLYQASKQNDTLFSQPINFAATINSPFNESTAVFTKDGKTMYFTRNNYLEGKKGRDKGKNKENTTLLKIYKASFSNGTWTNIKELPFNSDHFNTAHPALSADEKTLYFASDRPGTLGGADIFKVAIKDNNQYGKVEHLGDLINTVGRESFPYIAPNGKLYFASDGHLGYGGLDIFESNYENESFQKPINMGKPINSVSDDFGLITKDLKTGYFTSNRTEGLGYDDIYQFKPCKIQMNLQVTDTKTQETILDPTITLQDEEGNQIHSAVTYKNGFYWMEMECHKTYFLRTQHPEYETVEQPIEPLNTSISMKIQLQRSIFPFEIGTDLAKVFDISIIYFDLDKSNIRPDAARDIQKVIEVMKEYPKMHVAIRSHTDSRQTHKYNEGLSDRRAKSTFAFMVANGIEAERLTAQGFGEVELVNECADGVYCSEEDHQKNRRSEFIVTKVE